MYFGNRLDRIFSVRTLRNNERTYSFGFTPFVLNRRRNQFFTLVSEGTSRWEEEEQRETLRYMLMTASDLAASTKRWDVQRKVAELVTAEFFAQVSFCEFARQGIQNWEVNFSGIFHSTALYSFWSARPLSILRCVC